MVVFFDISIFHPLCCKGISAPLSAFIQLPINCIKIVIALPSATTLLCIQACYTSGLFVQLNGFNDLAAPQLSGRTEPGFWFVKPSTTTFKDYSFYFLFAGFHGLRFYPEEQRYKVNNRGGTEKKGSPTCRTVTIFRL